MPFMRRGHPPRGHILPHGGPRVRELAYVDLFELSAGVLVLATGLALWDLAAAGFGLAVLVAATAGTTRRLSAAKEAMRRFMIR